MMDTNEISTTDLRVMLHVAAAVIGDVALRIPIGHQIRGLANTAIQLREILRGCIDGDAESLAAAREILGSTP